MTRHPRRDAGRRAAQIIGASLWVAAWMTASATSGAATGNVTRESLAGGTDLQLVLVPGLSTVQFVGRSALFRSPITYRFSGTTHQVDGAISASFQELERARGRVSIPVGGIEGAAFGEPRTALTEDIHANRDGGTFPTISFSIARAQAVALDVERGHATITVDGELSIRGVTRPVAIDVEMTLESGFLRFRGAYRLDMRDFQMSPKPLLGVVAGVEPGVDVTIDVYAQRKESR